jgi:hypothetical protein
LAYCETEKRWTLSQYNGTETDHDPCNWLAASTESTAFNVLSIASSPWIVKTPSKRVLPLAQHFLACCDEICASGDFNRDPNPNPNPKGSYKCKEGFYGLLCEKQEPPCQTLEINIDGEGFIKAGGRYFASTYYLLENATTYNHPVYTSLGDNEDDAPNSDDVDFIFFTGVRWIMSYNSSKDKPNKDGLVEFYRKFHPRNFTDYGVSFFSEPVHIVTLADIDETAASLGVRWFPYIQEDVDEQWLHNDLEKIQPRLHSIAQCVTKKILAKMGRVKMVLVVTALLNIRVQGVKFLRLPFPMGSVTHVSTISS